jgi:hypothetical protein
MDACKDVAIFNYLGLYFESAGSYCTTKGAVVASYAGSTTNEVPKPEISTRP